MIGHPPPLEQEPLGTLFGRLVDDGRDLARAEVALYKEIALDRAAKSRNAVIFLAVALLLSIAGTVLLLLSLGHLLGRLVGPGWGAFLAGLIGFAIAGILAKMAVSRLSLAFSGKDAR